MTDISTHALREEGDGLRWPGHRAGPQFLPTPSARRATGQRPVDVLRSFLFLPTPSARRATHMIIYGLKLPDLFLPTPSARRATRQPARLKSAPPISTHALREEGDLAISGSVLMHFYFYPRPPRGGRLSSRFQRSAVFSISTHALREEGDERWD